MEALLRLEFAMATNLNISPYHLNKMDFGEVLELNRLLAKLLRTKKGNK